MPNIQDQVGSNQATGNFKLWDSLRDSPAYAVVASTAAHIQEAVRFADKHKLRLSIKNTGHDWCVVKCLLKLIIVAKSAKADTFQLAQNVTCQLVFGRYGRNTAAVSLQVWTHHMKTVKFADVTVCGKRFPQSVQVGAGVQWVDVVPGLIERGLYTTYGTSMSVGAAGGFMQGGGFPAITGEFGTAADNIIRLEVVTADGALVDATPCSHPDLFWALRGGGGGTFGVVTRAWYQTHDGYEVCMTALCVNGRPSDSIIYGVVQMFAVILHSLTPTFCPLRILVWSTSTWSSPPVSSAALTRPPGVVSLILSTHWTKSAGALSP